MKKFTYIALAAVLCASLFAGCRSRSNPPMPETTMPAPSTMATTEPSTAATTHPATEAPTETRDHMEEGILDTTPGNDMTGGDHTESTTGVEGRARRIPGNH